MWYLTIAVLFTALLFKTCEGCRDGEIQLVGAEYSRSPTMTTQTVSGYVQLCIGGMWMDICSTVSNGRKKTWTQNDKMVACRQINKENSNILIFPRNLTEIMVQRTCCLSYEERLIDCSTIVTTDSTCITEAKISNCELYSQDDARVCESGKVELSSSGAVRVCYDNSWGYICGDFWTNEQAAVVCRQLKQPTYETRAVKVHSANETDTILHLQYTCEGTESALTKCRKSWLLPAVAHECKVLSGVMCGGLPDSAKKMNVTSLSPTSVRVSWIIQYNDIIMIDSFTVTCNSSGHNTISLSGSLQNTFYNGKHAATVNGLDSSTLYTCCVTLKNKIKGSSSKENCTNVQMGSLPTSTIPISSSSVGLSDNHLRLIKTTPKMKTSTSMVNMKSSSLPAHSTMTAPGDKPTTSPKQFPFTSIIGGLIALALTVITLLAICVVVLCTKKIKGGDESRSTVTQLTDISESVQLDNPIYDSTIHLQDDEQQPPDYEAAKKSGNGELYVTENVYGSTPHLDN